MAVDHNNPQSRNEEILIATIDGNEYNKAPQSRMEELLLELKETIEEGGGGGTTNYENLSNQPQINGETLIGDKTGADLGLVDTVEGKGLSTNDYDDNEKAAVAAATSAISAIKDGADIDSFGDVEVALLDKADTADLGTAAAKDSTNAVTAGSTDLVESGAVKDAIDSAVSRAYHHAGTKTVAQLTHDLLIAANEGNVYEMTDSGTTTSDFMEGIGRPIKEGDNVGIARVSEGVYKFDLLSGFVDTTNFVQKSQTSGLLKNDGTVNNEIEDDVDTLTEDVSDIKSKIDDATTYPYADVITIEDTVPANLAACSVKVEPVQDLHGYDKPWVGGAGINKLYWNPEITLPIEQNGITITSDGNGGIYLNGTSTGPVQVISAFKTDILSGQTTLCKLASANNNGVIYAGNRPGESYTSYTYGYDTFTGDGKWRLDLYINSSGSTFNNLHLQPMVIMGSDHLTEFSPYENICPITGHTDAVVTVADDDTDPTVTNTYTLALGDTIYGGTIRIGSDGNTVMSVTKKCVDLGSLDFTYDESQRFTVAISDMRSASIREAHFVTSCYLVIDDGRPYSQVPDFCAYAGWGGTSMILTIHDSRYSDAATYKTAITGQKICYELATPTTIQLTPKQIQLLQGTNTLYASTGDISVSVNGVSGAIGQVQEQVNDHEEQIDSVKTRLIASSESTGTTQSKLNGLYTAWQGLSDNEKRRAYIFASENTKYNLAIEQYRIFNSTAYSASDSALISRTVELKSNTSTLVVVEIKDTGTTITDKSLEETTTIWYLYA